MCLANSVLNVGIGSFSTILAEIEGWLMSAPVRKRRTRVSPYLYRIRNQVERFFNRIKHCRRVTTRYDRLAAKSPESQARSVDGEGKRPFKRSRDNRASCETLRLAPATRSLLR